MMDGLAWTVTCEWCNAHKFSQDPEPLIAWAESHDLKCERSKP